ncbi:MAG: hypothetical protein ABMA64_19485 [Myxococcota bacterium]
MTRALLALSLILPILACTSADLPLLPAPPPEPVEVVVDPATRHLGTWRMGPSEERARELKIIDAALSDKPQKVQRLGTLTPDEQKLFDRWVGKPEAETEGVRRELRLLRKSTVSFDQKQVTVSFGEQETFGPVPYEQVEVTDTSTVVRFDPGMNNGLETHKITWVDDKNAVDVIIDPDGHALGEVQLTRRVATDPGAPADDAPEVHDPAEHAPAEHEPGDAPAEHAPGH